MAVFLNRLALVLVLAGALFFVVRDGGKEAVSGDPEALWDSGVERVDAMISQDAHGALNDSLNGSMTYAEDFGSEVGAIAD